MERVGFNIEEIEGPHQQSSLTAPGAEHRFRQFLSRLYDLTTRPGSPVRVREFDSMLGAILHGGRPRRARRRRRPSPSCPSTIGGTSPPFPPNCSAFPVAHYGDFLLGNVFADSLGVGRPRAALRGHPSGHRGRHRAMPRGVPVLLPVRWRRPGQQVLREWLVRLDRDALLPLLSQIARGRAAGQTGVPSAPWSRSGSPPSRLSHRQWSCARESPSVWLRDSRAGWRGSTAWRSTEASRWSGGTSTRGATGAARTMRNWRCSSRTVRRPGTRPAPRRARRRPGNAVLPARTSGCSIFPRISGGSGGPSPSEEKRRPETVDRTAPSSRA